MSAARGLTLVLLVLLYFVAGKLGLTLAFVNASASAVWPPTGLAIAALLLLGHAYWPAILIGAFAVNLTTSGDLASSMGIAAGNTLEAVIAAGLLTSWAGGRGAFERPQGVLRFALVAASAATVVSATIGATSLALAGLARWSEFGAIWVTWWLGDLSGALILTPAIVLWAGAGPPRRERLGVVALIALATIGTGFVVFGGAHTLSIDRYPIAFLCFPVLVWAAFSFGPRGAATSALALAAIAVWGTLNGYGPYALASQNESLVLLQAFMAVAAVTSLTLGAAVLDRRRSQSRVLAIEQRLRVVAEDAARVREEFLSVATHELRTPLTGLTAYAQLAQRALETGERDRLASALESIARQSVRLGALITNLLDASRVGAGQLEVEPRPSELSVLTANAVEAARLVDQDRHRWELRIDRSLRANVDPLRWEQVVANLVENAMKYSPAGRTITVRLRGGGGVPVSLEVSDDGIGIAPDRLARVFDRFYRAHADQGMGGLGLGLYITRDIVERHGGRIEAASDAGRGSTFTVTLPASPPPATPEALPATEAQPAHATTPAGRRILVVDDDGDVRTLVDMVLREAGYDVTTVQNGEEALAVATRRRPDLILLDKLMPVMDGTAFARAYRAASPDPAPIVAFCAARDAEEWARSIGAVAFVEKPFDVDDLARVVRAQLNGSVGS